MGTNSTAAEERHARFALRLYHIPERERLAAEVVIDHTLGVGETWAIIPLAVFTAQTGMPARELVRWACDDGKHPAPRGILWRLARKNIILIHDVDSTRGVKSAYSFQADNTLWTATRRPVADSVIQRVLPAILAPGPDFRTSLAELGRQAVVHRLVTPAGGDSPPTQAPLPLPPYPSLLPPEPDRDRVTRPVDFGATRVGGGGPQPKRRRAELMADVRRILGDREADRNGGIWVERYDENPAAVRDALASTKIRADQLRRDAQVWDSSAAAYATKCWANFVKGRLPYGAGPPSKDGARSCPDRRAPSAPWSRSLPTQRNQV